MRIQHKHLILGTIFLAATVLSAPAHAAAALLEMVAGAGANPAVQVKRGSDSLKLKKGDELKPGDELTTDRSVTVDIRLEDRTLIRVGVNSSYRLEEDSAAKKLFHRLLSGIVRVLVPKGDKKGEMKLEMKTAEGTIGVRGTEFVVVKSDGETLLKGLEGEVTFGGAGASFAEAARFVPVRGGFESRVKAGASAPAAPQAFDLDAYLKTIDSPDGPFRGLVNRARAATKTRSRESAPAAPAVVAAAPVVKAKPSVKAEISKQAKAPAKNDANARLFQAAYDGNVAGMMAAVKAGAKVNQTSFEMKLTPLHAAVSANRIKAVMWLLENRADANAQNSRGRTPLMELAAEGGSTELVVLLEEKGKTDTSIQDSDKLTALELAKFGAASAKDKEHKENFDEIIAVLSDDGQGK